MIVLHRMITMKLNKYTLLALALFAFSFTYATGPGPVFKDVSLNALWQNYDGLEKAIFSANVATAKTSASKLADAAKTLKNFPAISTETQAIATSTTIDAQRKHFALLSKLLTPVFKSSGLTSGSLYVAHCPMYNGGSDWLTAEKEVKNPFYGSQMPECGKITEAIK